MFRPNGRISWSGGGGGGGAALEARVAYLEANEYKVSYYAEINAASGTITKPTGSTILLDQLAGGADAYVSTISNGKPTGTFPQTAGGAVVTVSSFDTSGNFTLSGTPSGFPVALIYVLKIAAVGWQNLTTANILDLENIQAQPRLYGAAGTYLRFNGLTADAIVSTLVLPNTSTINRIVYSPTANTYGDSSAITWDGAANGLRLDVPFNQYAQTWARSGTNKWNLNIDANDQFRLNNIANSKEFFFSSSGNLGIRVSSPTAALNLPAGTATASTAPQKFTTGTILATAEAGVKEFNGVFYSTKTSALRYAEGGVIADFTATVDNSGTGETDLYTYTTPASTLAGTGEKLEFKFSGTFNDITATAQLKVLFAGTTIGDTTALTIAATGAWVITGWVIRTGASTARASVEISTPTGSIALYTAQTDLTGLTFTNTNILKCTGTAGGGGGGNADISAKLGTISWYGPAAN